MIPSLLEEGLDAAAPLPPPIGAALGRLSLPAWVEVTYRPDARHEDPQEIPTEPLLPGALALRCGGGNEHLSGCIGQCVRAALEQEAARRREAALLEELSVAWESLDALYELNADLRQAGDGRQLLQRLLERASQAGLSLTGSPLSVVLLERRGAQFAASVACRTPGLQEGDAVHWMEPLGALEHTRVLNGSRQIQALGETAPYLAHAQGLVATPVSKPGEEQSVLVAWSEGAGFETPAVRLLESLALHAGMMAEGERLRAALLAKQRMEHDLEIGAAIQSMLLVEAPPEASGEYEAAVYTLASQTVDGDFYDFVSHADGALDIVIGDVMGKGLPAALVGAAAKSCVLRALGMSGTAPVRDILDTVSRRLSRNLIQLERFVTLCYARLDRARRRLTYVDCGHTGILHYRSRSRDCAFLHGSNMPIGFAEGEIYEEQTVLVAPGDVLLFYSDGVTESRSPAGEMYGEERLGCLLAKHAGEEAAQVAQHIRGDTAAFRAGPAADDLTCLVLKIAPLRRVTTVRAPLTELARLRQWLREFVSDSALSGCDAAFVESMELALTEAASNVVRHAQAGADDAGFEVALLNEGRRLVAEICYNGRPFDPDSVAEPDFDGSRSSGFGIFLIRHSVDQATWETLPDGSQRLTLLKVYEGDL